MFNLNVYAKSYIKTGEIERLWFYMIFKIAFADQFVKRTFKYFFFIKNHALINTRIALQTTEKPCHREN